MVLASSRIGGTLGFQPTLEPTTVFDEDLPPGWLVHLPTALGIFESKHGDTALRQLLARDVLKDLKEKLKTPITASTGGRRFKRTCLKAAGKAFFQAAEVSGCGLPKSCGPIVIKQVTTEIFGVKRDYLCMPSELDDQNSERITEPWLVSPGGLDINVRIMYNYTPKHDSEPILFSVKVNDLALSNDGLSYRCCDTMNTQRFDKESLPEFYWSDDDHVCFKTLDGQRGCKSPVKTLLQLLEFRTALIHVRTTVGNKGRLLVDGPWQGKTRAEVQAILDSASGTWSEIGCADSKALVMFTMPARVYSSIMPDQHTRYCVNADFHLPSIPQAIVNEIGDMAKEVVNYIYDLCKLLFIELDAEGLLTTLASKMFDLLCVLNNRLPLMEWAVLTWGLVSVRGGPLGTSMYITLPFAIAMRWLKR